MKKEKWLIAAIAGATAAAIVYTLLPKDEIPEGATAVKPFDINQYLGKWYEVARLANRIEKNIKNLTEEYTLRDDGLIKVITKGYNFKKDKWTEFEGKIKFTGAEDVGMLKVSYFGPAYASYNILDIDPEYKYALVSGSGLGYLWILSRETSIPGNIKRRFLKKAQQIGFDINKLVWGIA